ncbi:MAG: DUF4054 domain-containing protein [Chloroflexota bacterium]|nr:DUF4054 domain-containing protein [Chloroflexota bacterium]
MSYVLPSIGDFKGQFFRDFPYATPLRPKGVTPATLTATLNPSGGVSGITVVDGGAGYSQINPMSVTIYGGGGMAAVAGTVSHTSGVITAVAVSKAGYGYTVAPQVYLGVGDNTDTERVTDPDIAAAFTVATQFNLTQGLFPSQAAFAYAYNLLTAHYLCEAVRAGTTGLGGKGDWLVSMRKVGNVSENFEIPPRILNSPFLAKLSKTTYGAQFLELVSPQLVANMVPFHRITLP